MSGFGERTHELRELLYAKGVAYEEHDDEYINGYLVTKWDAADGRIASYVEDERGVSAGMGEITPMEAIAATLDGGANANTRWAELFGTPERAARTLAVKLSAPICCKDCAIFAECARTDPDGTCMLEDERRLLEWLEGNCEEGMKE